MNESIIICPNNCEASSMEVVNHAPNFEFKTGFSEYVCNECFWTAIAKNYQTAKLQTPQQWFGLYDGINIFGEDDPLPVPKLPHSKRPH